METKPSIYASYAIGGKYPIIGVSLPILYLLLIVFAPKILTSIFIRSDVILNPQHLWALTNASLLSGLFTYFITGLIVSRFNLLASVEQVFITRITAAGLVYVLAIPVQFMVWMNPHSLHVGETYDLALFKNGSAYQIEEGIAKQLPRQSSSSTRVIDYSLQLVSGEPTTVSGKPMPNDYKKPNSKVWIKNGLIESHHHLAFRVYVDSIQISAKATETSHVMSNEMDHLDLLDRLHPEKNLDQRIFFCPNFVTDQKTIIVMPYEHVELEFNMPNSSGLYFQKNTEFDFLRMTVDLIPIPTDENLIKGTKIPFSNDPTWWLRQLDS